MGEVQEESTGGKKRKGGKIVVAIALCIIIAILVCVILYLLNSQEDDEKRNVVVTPDNVDEVIRDMSEHEYTAPGYYATTMTNEWHFENADAISEDAYVENAVENTNDVFFDVFLADDEENAIYESPLIPRGSSLSQISLESDLEAGTYDCVLIYHLVDEEQNTLSTLRVSITIVVEN